MKSQKVINKYSDKELLTSIAAVGRKETDSTAEILLHLAEIDSRKLYLKEGYNSLFDFCTRGALHYSEGAAQRRIIAARAIARFPKLLEAFVSRKINLCTLSLISPLLNEENFSRHIEAISGKSKRKVEIYLASCRPGKEIRESIKPVYVAPEKQEPVKTAPLFTRSQPAETMEDSTATGGSNNSGRLAEQKFELRFQVKDSVMRKYREVQALLSGKYPKGVSMEDMLDEVLELYLEKHSPKKRQERRKARQEKKMTVKNSTSISGKDLPNKIIHDEQSRAAASRYIPQEIQDLVYIRDSGQCTYVGPDGVRCGCRHNLHIDHILPYAVSRDNSISNLRLLCSSHNAYQAELFFGKDHMNKYLRKTN